MTEVGRDERRGSGILDAYCGEIERLATTLCDLLDVADRRTDLCLGDELESILRIEPAVSRLGRCLARSRRRLTGGEPETDSVNDWLDERTIEDMCRSAVQATVAEMLAARGEPWSDELRLLLTSVSGNDHGDVQPEDVEGRENDDGERVGPEVDDVPPERTLSALLDDVGRWSSLHGTADTMPIAGLFTMLATSGKTGCLHLRRTDEHLRFVIANGVVVATATTRSSREELLGEILVSRGWLSKERRHELVALARSRQRPLGALAVDEGDLTVEMLSEALQEQVHARFDRVFRDASVAYAFVPVAHLDVDGRLRVHAQDLLFEGALRADRSAGPGPGSPDAAGR